MSKGKKILVTGGAGYLGSHTILELIEHTGYEIVSVDNFSNSSPSAFDRIERISGKRISNHAIDLSDEAAVKRFFAGEKDIIGIIHFAALKSVPDSVANPQLYYHNNNGSLRNILGNMPAAGAKYCIFSSSCSVYGNISKLPVSEHTPIGRAESPYAETKQQGEKMLEQFAERNRGMKVISLRYFNPVGAHPSGLLGESPLNPPTNLAPLITGTAAGRYREFVIHGHDYNTRDGTCVRDYIHVSDIAYAHVKALNFLIENEKAPDYDVFNLGTGKGVTVLEAVKAFEKASGIKLNYRMGPRRKGDVEAIYSDCSKARTVLGWSPKYDIEDMMGSAWKWELNCGDKVRP
ncbi:MAG: UDP-glucose 4-epimerase GalE [Bacteroidota bacterium]